MPVSTDVEVGHAKEIVLLSGSEAEANMDLSLSHPCRSPPSSGVDMTLLNLPFYEAFVC